MLKRYNLIKNWIGNNFLPIFFIFGGIIEETTDALVELLDALNAPLWIAPMIKIFVIIIGAFKLYNSLPKSKRNLKNYNKIKERND